mmetsp:Transcript_36844/g.91723  ORF Transcript_36844/g.91723 Transcript_36844/m.91723 type:complete len:146 (-) Transcript_36844:223-660(-)
MSTADVVIVGVPLSELGGPPSPPPPAPPRPGKGDKGDEGLWRWVQALTARTLTNAGKLDPNVVLIVRPHRRHRGEHGSVCHRHSQGGPAGFVEISHCEFRAKLEMPKSFRSETKFRTKLFIHFAAKFRTKFRTKFRLRAKVSFTL